MAHRKLSHEERRIAYFSMEIALDSKIPTYSGGLGVLAGDTIRAAADMGVPMVAVTLLHRKGYFQQQLDNDGRQTEEPMSWSVETLLQEQSPRVTVRIENRDVRLRAWCYEVVGLGGAIVPVVFLDSDLEENAPEDRELTHWLYGGDNRYRLCQEALLGIGGIRMLEAIGCTNISRFHMNEGHSSLLTLELLDQEAKLRGRQQFNDDDIRAVRRRCIFTTHTPVAAGHDQFPVELVEKVLGRSDIKAMAHIFCRDGALNMTYMALNLSRYINGVAKRHREVSQDMFSQYVIDAITNGVHVPTWTSPAFATLYDRFIPGWRSDNFSLRHAMSIPAGEVWAAHQQQKDALFAQVARRTGVQLDPDVLTIGYARRMTAYKRPGLILSDMKRLAAIAKNQGPLQLIYAGKAHPRDTAGKEAIQQVHQASQSAPEHLQIVMVENYDVELGALITAGVDVWLNTPEPPLEASGTSGMKAALNGVPSLSILDGWWLEGCIEGLTGWAIGADGYNSTEAKVTFSDAEALYQKLEQQVMPAFYQQPERFRDTMRYAMALNGSYFNTQRMLQEYVVKAYLG